MVTGTHVLMYFFQKKNYFTFHFCGDVYEHTKVFKAHRELLDIHKSKQGNTTNLNISFP